MTWVSFSPPRLPLPRLPPTLGDMDVPRLFQRRFIVSGYRPLGMSWSFYVLTLFQIHNETLSVWSPLVVAVCVTARFLMFTILQGGGVLAVRLQGPEEQGFSVDVASLPLVVFVFCSIAHLSFSAAAHLLHPHSEEAHYFLFYLENVSVSVYLYSLAVALSVYSSDHTWTQSMLGQTFLPFSFVVSWFSCIARCLAKLRPSCPCQLILVGVSSVQVVSPVAHRLLTCSWSTGAAVPVHVLQVVLFLLAFVVFSSSAPECFSPGRFDTFGHAHQLFHLLLSLCILIQQEALFSDFLWRRPALVRQFGEDRLLREATSILWLTLCCMLTVAAVKGRSHRNWP